MKLVVGGNGKIGRALLAAFAASGITAVGSTRNGDGGTPRIDLTAATSQWDIPPGVDQAFLLAAETSMTICEQDPVGTTHVNVDAIVELGKRLLSRGGSLVFPSTDKVFDGMKPLRSADDAPCPITAYGHQKALAEAELLALGNTVVLRLSKVITPDFPLFCGWVDSLLRGEAISPFVDATLSPVPLNLVVSVLQQLSVTPTEGVLQLSAAGDLSYAEVAIRLADLVGCNRALIQPQAAPQGMFPPYTSLDDTALKAATGFLAPDPGQALVGRRKRQEH